MKIEGCDLHTRYQQIAMLDTETGELMDRGLEHAQGEARAFYASLQGAVRVGVEATGYTRWFERMLAELGHELWIGDAAEIRASMVRKQKTDARDAAHLLDLLISEPGTPGLAFETWDTTAATRLGFHDLLSEESSGASTATAPPGICPPTGNYLT